MALSASKELSAIDDLILESQVQDNKISETSNSTPKLTPREIITMKKEAIKKAEEQNFTFHPKLIAKDKGSLKSDGSSRFDKLYTDAVKRQLGEASRTPELEAFQPQFYTSPGKRRAQSPQKVGDRLYDAAMTTLSKRGVDTNSTPTFKPTISKRASSSERSRDVPIGEQLYSKAQQLKEKQDKLKADADERLKQQYSFEPKTFAIRRPSTSPADASTIAERSLKLEQEKQMRLNEARKLQLEAEMQESTFTPNIEPARRRATPARTGDLFQRLSVSVDKDKPLPPEFTFRPNIGAYPVERENDAGESVHDRLFKEAEHKKREIEREMDLAKVREMAALTFKPQISAAPAYDVANCNESDDEKSQTKQKVPAFLRLSISDKQQMQNVLSQLRLDIEMSECTFKPQIPQAASSRVANSTPVHERLNAEAAKLRVDAKIREELRKQEEVKGLKSKPEIDPNSIEIVTSLSRRNSFASPTQGSLSRSTTPTQGHGTSNSISLSSSISSLNTHSQSQRRPSWNSPSNSKERSVLGVSVSPRSRGLNRSFSATTPRATSATPSNAAAGVGGVAGTASVSQYQHVLAAASPGSSYTPPPPPSVAELAAVFATLGKSSSEKPKIIRGQKKSEKTNGVNGAHESTVAAVFTASELEELQSAIEEANGNGAASTKHTASNGRSLAARDYLDSDDDTLENQDTEGPYPKNTAHANSTASHSLSLAAGSQSSPTVSPNNIAERKKLLVRLGSGGRDLPPVEVPAGLAPDEKVGLRWGCDPDDTTARHSPQERLRKQYSTL